MARQHVYTVDRMSPSATQREQGTLDVFRVAKHSREAVLKDVAFPAEEGEYTVLRKPIGMMCDCYAGLMGKQCRHIETVMIAEDTAHLNTGDYYDFDRKKWLNNAATKPLENL